MWVAVPTRVLLLNAILRAEGFAAPPLSSRSVSEVVGTRTKERGSVVLVEVLVVALVEVGLVEAAEGVGGRGRVGGRERGVGGWGPWRAGDRRQGEGTVRAGAAAVDGRGAVVPALAAVLLEHREAVKPVSATPQLRMRGPR